MRVSIYAAAAIALSSFALPAHALEDYSVFKASIMFAVDHVVVGQEVDKLVTKTITSKEFVNLSLGRPIDQVLDAKHEVFALAVAFDQPTDPDTHQNDTTPHSKFILWDPGTPATKTTAAVPGHVVATLATVTEIDFDDAYGASSHKGLGVGNISIPEGVGPDNKFFPTTLRFAGRGTTPLFPLNGNQISTFAVTMTGLSGRVHFSFKSKKAGSVTTDWWGIAVKGTITTSGKSLAHFEE